MKKKKPAKLTKRQRKLVKENVDFLTALEDQCRTPEGFKRFFDDELVNGYFPKEG